MRLEDLTKQHVLHRSPRVEVSRQQRVTDGTSVILKALPPEQLHHSAIARLRYEHRVLQVLHEHQARHVPQPLGLVEQAGTAALVLSDLGGTALRAAHAERPLSLIETLSVGRDVAEALVDIHRARVVHKDINPNNIVYARQAGAIELVDFDLASMLARELQSVDNLTGLEGTLPYISPEQTGRQSRALDYRTDFFSLGVTLYELLSGQVPFAGADVSEVVYAILTHVPPPLHTLLPEIPPVVSHIVTRLLEKDPERRYKSAFGLHHDLAQCCAAWQGQGRIETFALAAQDRSERFEIPQRLYGRETEVAQLLQAYGRLASGHHEVLLITGPSGAGKSVLVRELQGAMLQQHGLFVAGKYEQLRRHVPFNAIGQALAAAVRHILLEPTQVLQAWQRRLQGALGSIGQSVVDIVPSLERLVGKQRPLVALGPQEHENRLLMALQRLLLALSKRQPLVLFLDDLQWADHGTLKLLHRMAVEPHDGCGILLMGAYRDNEVGPEHALRGVVRDIEQGGVTVTTVAVGPLDLPATTALIVDTTAVSASQAEPLAALLLTKTYGIALFIHEFLNNLRRLDLLRLDPTARAWTWDLDAVRAAVVTANVAALLEERLRTLAPTQRALQSMAACLGTEFTLAALVEVMLLERAQVVQGVDAALQQGFLVPVGGAYRYAADDSDTNVRYRFAHDRLQQAAHDLLSPEALAQHHLTIGRYLVRVGGSHDPETWAVQAVDHLNHALPLLQDETERLATAQLNLLAGKQAQRATAYGMAQEYLRKGMLLLPPNSWLAQPSLTRQLHEVLAQSLAMDGQVQEANTHLDSVQAHTQSSLALGLLAEQRVQLMTIARQPEIALDAGVAGLRAMGVRVVRKPSLLRVLWAYVRLRLMVRGTNIAALTQAVPRPTPEAELVNRMARTVGEAGVLFMDPLLWVLCMLTSVRVLAQHRMVNHSTFPVNMIVLTASPNQYEDAMQWAHVARAWAPQDQHYPSAVATAEFHIAAYTDHLHVPPTTLVRTFGALTPQALEHGNTLLAAHTGTAEIIVQFCLSLPACADLIAHAPPLTQLAREFDRQIHDVFRMACDVLLDRVPETVLTPFFDDYMQRHAEQNLPVQALRGPFRFVSCVVACVHRDLDTAVDAAALSMADGAFQVATDHILLIFAFFGCLACTQRVPPVRARWFGTMRQKIRRAGEAGPIYRGMTAVIDAGLAAARGRHEQATALYEEGTAHVAQSGYTAMIAGAFEAAGRYHAQRKTHSAARTFLQRARDAYGVWGARRKVRMLEREFPHLLHDASATWRPHSTKGSARVEHQELDLPAVMQLTQALAAEVVQSKLAEKILRSMEKVAGATRAALFLRPAELLQQAADTHPEGPALPQDLLAFVMRAQEQVHITNLEDATQFRDSYRGPVRPKTVLCAPLMHQGAVRGVIYLENNVASGAFGSERILLVEMLAAQAAIALENARLYANLEEVVAKRTADLQQAHRRLLELERQAAETQMAGGFAHEMRNALGGAMYSLETVHSSDAEALGNSLAAQLQALNQAVAQQAPWSELQQRVAALIQDHEASQDALEVVHHGVLRGLHMTDKILEYARVGDMVVGEGSAALGPLVDQVLQEYSARLQQQRVRTCVEVPAQLQVPMQPEHTLTILRNLVGNALDALKDDPVSPEVTVQAKLTAQSIVVQVADNGAGMTPEDQRRVFQPFFSTKGAQGSGLGLGLCRKITRAYGGELSFHSEAHRGTTFEVKVPVR